MTETNPANDHVAREEGLVFMPRFDQNGLITAVAVEHKTHQVLEPSRRWLHIQQRCIWQDLGRTEYDVYLIW
jgi:hypothetical protein